MSKKLTEVLFSILFGIPIYVVAFAFMSLIVFIPLWVEDISKGPERKVGDILYQPERNPFKEKTYIKIKDIKDGYFQYGVLDKDGKEIKTESNQTYYLRFYKSEKDL